MSIGGRLAVAKGRRSALGCTAFASKGAGCSSKAVVKTTRGETWPVSRLVKLQVYDNGPIDPWPLHHDHCLNRLKSTHPIGSRGAPTDR